MRSERALWWKRAAQTLSRSGLLWLALTIVALSSLASPSAGVATHARLLATSNVGSTGKLKASGPGIPTIVRGELSRAVPPRAQNPEAADKRVLAGGMPAALTTVEVAVSASAGTEHVAPAGRNDAPIIAHSAFAARAPPRFA